MNDVEDITYRNIDGHSLLGRIYRPQKSGPTNWVVDVHGGAWGSGDRLNNAVIHEDLARNGIGVFSLDFRLSDVAQHPLPVEDISYGIRWFKANKNALDLQVMAIGGLGASSGAQQLGLVALRPNDERWTTEDPALTYISSCIEFFVACWPVFDPLARYEMVLDIGNDRLCAAHDAYFRSKGDMVAANPYLILERDEEERIPPILIIQGTNDANVNHNWQDRFADLYKAKGGTVEVHKYEGQPHTFVTSDPLNRASIDAIKIIREFVLRA
ncbi:MAG: alpha/beta hydrolase [Pseudomonadota bacterium]|nr:alpha/beta hydrolase [Pseudomonadota bacterium]